MCVVRAPVPQDTCCFRRLHNGRGAPDSPPVRKPPYVKKPLNAFMLFMKEMRPKVIETCTLKESAAINQILGKKVLQQSRYSGCSAVHIWTNDRLKLMCFVTV